MSGYFPEPSDDIKQVIYEINHPRSDVWDIIKGHQEGDDYLEFLLRQFNEWIRELSKLIDADHQHWKYLVDFLTDLISMLRDFDLEQLGLFLQLYFPEGKEINFQALKDLDFAIAAITDGFRQMFDQVIQALGPNNMQAIQYPQVPTQIFKNYAGWALPEYYSIGKLMPGFINALAELHNQRALVENQEAEKLQEDLEEEDDPKKAKELIKEITNHLVATQVYRFDSQLLSKVKSRLKAEMEFIKNMKSYFDFNQADSIKAELPKVLYTRREYLCTQLFQSKEYLDLFKQGRITIPSDGNIANSSIGKFFPEEVRRIEKIESAIKSLEEKKLTEEEMIQWAGELGLTQGTSSYVEQVRSILRKWLDYMTQLEGPPIQAFGQPDLKIFNQLNRLPDMSLEELLALAKEYGIPLPHKA